MPAHLMLQSPWLTKKYNLIDVKSATMIMREYLVKGK